MEILLALRSPKGVHIELYKELGKMEKAIQAI